MTRALLECGAAPDAQDVEGVTPLHRATYSGHGEVVRALLAHGAVADPQNVQGVTPLQRAASHGHADAVRALLAGGASVGVVDHEGKDALMFAAYHGHTGVARLLCDAGAAVDAVDLQGKPALMFAADTGRVEVALLLLARGAAVDVLDDRGQNVLHRAARNGRAEMARALHEGGASYVRSAEGLTPMEVAMYHSQDGGDGALRTVRAMLEARGEGARRSVSEPHPWSGQLPLHIAAYLGSQPLMDALLAHGAEVDARALLQAGDGLVARGDATKARQFFEQASRLDPTSEAASLRLQSAPAAAGRTPGGGAPSVVTPAKSLDELSVARGGSGWAQRAARLWREQGAVVFPALLDGEAVAQLREAARAALVDETAEDLSNLIRQTGNASLRTLRPMAVERSRAPLAALATALAPFLAEALQSPRQLLLDFGAYRTRAGAEAQSLHTDSPFHDARVAHVQITLVDTAAGQGNLEVAPATHTTHRRREAGSSPLEEEEEGEGRAAMAVAPLPEGSVTLYRLDLLHRGGAHSLSGRGDRLIVTLKLMGELGFVPDGIPLKVRPEDAGRWWLEGGKVSDRRDGAATGTRVDARAAEEAAAAGQRAATERAAAPANGDTTAADPSTPLAADDMLSLDADLAAVLAGGGERSRGFAGLDEDAIDLAAFESVRDDDLPTALAAFATMLSHDREDAFAAMWLGNLAARKGNLPLAERALAHAVAHVGRRMQVEDNKEAYAVAAKRKQLELSLRRVRERRAGLTGGSSSGNGSAGGGAGDGAGGGAGGAGGGAAGGSVGVLRVLPIRRVHHSQMGQLAFEAEHAEPRLPVIIEGFGSLSTCLSSDGGSDQCSAWTIELLNATCGHLRPPLATYSATSASWAGMFKSQQPPSSFGAYLDAVSSADGSSPTDGSPTDGSSQSGDGSQSGTGMVFDWALRHKGEGEGCAALLRGLQIPSYFGGTILSGFGPSLFVQPNGTRCGLHFDRGATHFWQYVWTGRKHWRIFKPVDYPRLFEPHAWRRAFFRDVRCAGLFGPAAEEAAGCADGFGTAPPDAFDDAALERLAGRGVAPLEVFDATLGPSDLLFVPAGAPHQVANVGGGATVAMSMNYVDFTNADEAFRTLLEDTDLHPKYRSRLNKRGRVVTGSQTRWYERFKMPIEGKEQRRMQAVAQHVQQQQPRPDAAFLEPWQSFEKRPWNLHLVSG